MSYSLHLFDSNQQAFYLCSQLITGAGMCAQVAEFDSACYTIGVMDCTGSCICFSPIILQGYGCVVILSNQQCALYATGVLRHPTVASCLHVLCNVAGITGETHHLLTISLSCARADCMAVHPNMQHQINQLMMLMPTFSTLLVSCTLLVRTQKHDRCLEQDVTCNKTMKPCSYTAEYARLTYVTW